MSCFKAQYCHFETATKCEFCKNPEGRQMNFYHCTHDRRTGEEVSICSKCHKDFLEDKQILIENHDKMYYGLMDSCIIKEIREL